MRRLNMNMNGDQVDFKRLPETKEEAAQYLLLYELSLPQGLDLTNMIDITKSSSRLIVMMDDVPSQAMLQLQEDAQAWAQANLQYATLTPATGTNIIFAHLTKTNIQSMLSGTILAFLLIALAIGLALKSFKWGLLSLVPNLAPAIMAFGIWSFFRTEIGLYAAFVTATSLGLIVDFTVHLLTV